MNSGKMPTGNTRIVCTLQKGQTPQGLYSAPGTAVVTQQEVSYHIVNISQLILNLPGTPFSNDTNAVPVLYEKNPQFAWTSDLQNISYQTPDNDRYEFAIYEKRNNMTSADEVLASNPLYRLHLKDNYLMYPLSGVTPLVEGRTYCWQVRALLKGPLNAGYDAGKLQSEVFAFRIGRLAPDDDPGDGTDVGGDTTTSVDTLRQSLLDSLNEYQFVSGTLNGQPINEATLDSLLQKIGNGRYLVEDINVK
jgi:hypothetical protein